MKKLSWLAGSLALAVLAGCGTNPASLTATRSADTAYRADGVSRQEIVVRFAKQPTSLGYTVLRTIKSINASIVAVPAGMSPEAVIADIKAKHQVTYAETVSRVGLDPSEQRLPKLGVTLPTTQLGVFNDPLLKDQYQHSITNALAAWDVTKGDRATTIAVIDTGVDPNHPDLKDKIASSWNVFSKTATVKDGSGHGTHTAGIAAAAIGNGQGGAGVAPECGLMIVQVLDDNGSGSEASIADGIVWGADHGAKVMTMSLGLYKRSKVVEDALQYALDRDVVLCASAGNSNKLNDPVTAPHLPSTYPGVIEVAASDSQDKKASFSNFGKTVSVAAPGVEILSTVPTYPSSDAGGTNYAKMSGTSMASPFAAGVVALIRSRHPEWKRDRVRQALEASAKDLGAAGFDQTYGNGRVDVLKAVQQ